MKLFQIMCPNIMKYYWIIAVFGYLNGFTDISDSCDIVKDEFRNISLEDLVPVRPIIDDRLKVCFKSLTVNQTSCCSYDSEMKYTAAAEQHLKNVVQAKIGKLKSQVQDHLEDYEGKLLESIYYTLNRTITRLSETYDFQIADERHSVVQLFHDIEDFLDMKIMTMTNSVSAFFDDMFAVILNKMLLRSSTKVTWSGYLRNCVTKNRQEIAPNPFGKFPDKVVKKLNSGLLIARAYLEALEVVAEALDATNRIVYTEACVHAVTRLWYCSHCQGFIQARPCKGFCLDVFRGCLSNMAVIGPEWNDLITAVEVLVREMSDQNLEDVVIELTNGIVEAVEHCEASFPEFYPKVVSMCQGHMGIHENNFTTIPIPRREKLTDLPSEASGPLYIDVIQFTLNLVDSKGLFKNLADAICSQHRKVDQDVNSSTCWNGTNVSVYRRHPVNADILSQARNNPEVKVSLVLDPLIDNLKDKMARTKLVLQTHNRKVERSRYQLYMISDEPDIENSGRDGEVPVGNITKEDSTVIGVGDDEDLNDDRMSGSGSGDNLNVDLEINSGNGGGNSDVVYPHGQKNGSPYEVDQGENLGSDHLLTRGPPNIRDSAAWNVPSLQLSVFFFLYL